MAQAFSYSPGEFEVTIWSSKTAGDTVRPFVKTITKFGS